MRFALRWINYRMHLIQYGVVSMARARPWLRIGPAVALFAPVWLIYCALYPMLAIAAAIEAAMVSRAQRHRIGR